jgi:Papain family cysteine protease
MASTLEQIQEAITQARASWQAGATSMMALTEHERQSRLGVTDRAAAVSQARTVAGAAEPEVLAAAIASSWDWRQNNGVTPVKDQGNCGSCVSFACVAALESILLIKHGYTANLSEGDLHFCSSHGANCGGWDPGAAIGQLETRGVCDSACAPYQPGVCNDCAGRDSRAIRTGGPASYVAAASFKNIINNDRPLVACFDVYEDFYSYTQGVYTHVTGNQVGSHCAEVIGYSDAGQYWICKNSWGTGWGEAGFFRISYRQCGIDDAMWQITDPIFLAVGVAFQANTGNLWSTGPIGTRDLGLGMRAGTSPSIAVTPGGDTIAFQANTGNLWTTGPDGTHDHGLGMMAGTSPSLAEVLGGYTVAFQANTGNLWTTGPDGTHDQGLGMMAGTSPSLANIAAVDGGWECAFQANTGNLWIVGHDNRGDMKLGMMAHTSPAITSMAGGGWECAFQANTGNLWVIGNDNRGDMHLGMMAGTSPHIRAVAGGWEVAFQANTGNLWTVGPDGAKDHGLGMMAHTSPSVARPA